MPGSGHRADVSPVPIPASGSSLPPVVPTIDAGKLTAGKAVIGLARAGAFPAAVPVVPTIDAGQFQGQADGGQAGHRPGKRRGFPRGRARGADDRGRATWQAGHRAAVPVVPMIDAAQFPGPASQRAAVPEEPTIDAGKLTPGKPVIDLASAGASSAAVPVVPTIDGGQACRVRGKAVIDLASAGASPAAVPVPMIDGGKLAPASRSSCRPWCRRAARSST